MGINRITAGVDPSDAAAVALTWAGELAEASSSDLRAIAAWQLPLVALMPEMMGALPDGDFLRSQTEAMLAKVAAEVGLADRCELVVAEGPPGPVLADSSSSDSVVVVGRYGIGQHHGLSRIIDRVLGSTAHHLVHHAEGPVAVVPADAEWVDDPKVLVGIDGSSASLDALRWTLDAFPTASILAVRTIIPWNGDPLAPVDAAFNPTVVAAAEVELAEWVATTVAASGRPDATVEELVEIGGARWTLTNPDFGADLIVVGHRGRTGLARMLGSVADHVVRTAHVPVIVTRTTD